MLPPSSKTILMKWIATAVGFQCALALQSEKKNSWCFLLLNDTNLHLTQNLVEEKLCSFTFLWLKNNSPFELFSSEKSVEFMLCIIQGDSYYLLCLWKTIIYLLKNKINWFATLETSLPKYVRKHRNLSLVTCYLNINLRITFFLSCSCILDILEGKKKNYVALFFSVLLTIKWPPTKKCGFVERGMSCSLAAMLLISGC